MHASWRKKRLNPFFKFREVTNNDSGMIMTMMLI